MRQHVGPPERNLFIFVRVSAAVAYADLAGAFECAMNAYSE